MTPTAPIDVVHMMSMQAIREIRDEVAGRRAVVATWEPRPMPDRRDSTGRYLDAPRLR